MSIYLSKKALKELAKRLDATKLCSNIYYYANIVHSSKNLIKELDLVDRVDMIVDGYINTEQIAYCGGVYGTTGQLHKVTYFDKIKQGYYTVFVCVY